MTGPVPAGGAGSPMAPEPFEVLGGDGKRLRAYRWVPTAPTAAKTAVLLVHGLGEHAGRYGPLLEAFLSAGHPVVSYDQRGHGASDGRRGVLRDFERLVDDLLAVAGAPEAMLPSGSVLYGHSMGGLVAIRALQRGDRRWSAAVLSAPWLATGLPVPFWKRVLRPVMLRIAPNMTVAAGLRGEDLTRDPIRRADRARDRAVHDRISPGLAAAAETAQDAALTASLPERLPVLLLAPGDDPITDVPVAVAWARATRATVTVAELPGVRHEPHNDEGREALFVEVLDWLASHSGD